MCLERLQKHRPLGGSFSALEIHLRLAVHDGWNFVCSFENKRDPACEYLVASGQQNGQLPQAGLRIPSTCSLHLIVINTGSCCDCSPVFSVLFYPGNVHLLPTHLWGHPTPATPSRCSEKMQRLDLGNDLQSLRPLEYISTSEEQSEKIKKAGTRTSGKDKDLLFWKE